MEIEEHRVSMDGMSVRYLCVGSGPSLLLLHGAGSSSSEWRWLMSELSGAWRVLAPDMPPASGGNGMRELYAPEDSVEFILSFLRAVRVARTVVAGHCTGGLSAVCLSLQKQDLVRALVLIDSGGLGQAIHPAMIMEASPLWGDLAVRLASTPVGAMHRALFRSLLLYSRPDRAPKQWWIQQYRLALEPGFLRASLGALRSSTGPLGQTRIFLDRLPELAMPVLLLWGSMDQVVPGYQALEARSRLRDGRLAFIPDCGHLPHVEKPDLCAREIGGFAAEALHA